MNLAAKFECYTVKGGLLDFSLQCGNWNRGQNDYNDEIQTSRFSI